jgi:HEAT repeat protein
VRKNAALALGNVGESVVELHRGLMDKNLRLRYGAGLALPYVGEAVPALGTALKDQDTDVRKNAALALSRVGKEARRVVPSLRDALKDHDPDVRKYAALALGNVGEEAWLAVPELGDALYDREADVRKSAAVALSKVGKEAVGPRSRMPIYRIIDALKDRDLHDPLTAVLAKGDAADVVPTLIWALENQQSAVARQGVALALGKFGPAAKKALDPLRRAIEAEKDIPVKESMRTALAEISK